LYNDAFLRTLSPLALDLLQVSAVVAPRGSPPIPGAISGPVQGAWQVYRLPDPPPRAELYPSYVALAPGKDFPNSALERITDPSFDPSRDLVVEAPPGVSLPQPGEGTRGPASAADLGP